MTNKIQYNFLQDKTCKKILSLLNKKDDTTRFVGGCVRDSLIGVETNDIDIATKLECSRRTAERVRDMIIQLKLNIIETRYDDGKKKWKIKGNFANLEQNIEKKDLENLLMTINTDQVKRNPKIFNRN